MRTSVPNHSLIGKRVDFDWRPNKEKELPYDDKNRNVDQNLLVTDVKKDCYGDEWCYLENRSLPQSVKRVCRIH